MDLTLVFLVLHVCGKATGICHDEQFPFMGELRTCQFSGQIMAAQWNADNLGWRVERYECKIRKLRAQSTQ